jgi:hypothetical protein
MSAFLGPIHMWLYNQIQIVEKREAEIVDKFSKKYSDTEVHNLIFPYRHQYGELKEDKPLAELIAGGDIHPWLESAIDSAQSREAAVVANLMDKYDGNVNFQYFHTFDIRNCHEAIPSVLIQAELLSVCSFTSSITQLLLCYSR